MNETLDSSSMNSSQIVYEFARATSLEGWWVWALMVGALAVLLYLCVRFYRRDVSELSKPIRIVLIFLRVATILALVFFFFDLQRRTQRMITRPSEVAVLVDTSQSMSLPTGLSMGSPSRSARATQLLESTDLITKLATEHRVSVYAFDDQAEPRLIETRGGEGATEDEPSAQASESVQASTFAIFGGLLIAIGLLLGLISLLIGAAGRSDAVGWWIVGSALTLVPGIICLGSVSSIRSDQPLSQILGVDSVQASSPVDDSAEEPAPPPTIRVIDWSQELAAAGSQSRIGDAIRNVLADHDPATLAGVVLLTDGQSNGGTETSVAVASARRSEVAIYPVGLGSSDAPINVRVVDLDAPRRVYPGDKFAISAVLQASGPRPIEVEVQLLDGLDNPDRNASDSSDSSDSADAAIVPPGDVIETQRVQVKSDGSLTAIRFELEPESVGRRRLAIRVVAPPEDQNQRDDLRDARYEVVARKLRVMVVAGGPTREYRFVRNLMFRDNSIELDAWLQTGQPGMSQDADRLLQSFPNTAEELFQYDVIAMFDPNWTAISLEQLDLLDRWLTQQAGGLIIVAGPVYHPQWTRLRTDPRVSRIAGFFPVNLSTRGPLLSSGRQGGELPWPLEFTPEASRAEFLWIADDPETSFQVWQDFEGVYDFIDARNPKAGAKVYAHFSDPTTEVGGSLPVYLASQFYGAGRVYFQGSGEMWRLRGASDAYFDSYYTKLVRWVSEGRLLRDSTRGVLLVDSSKAMVGDNITVRAVLTDEQFEPLDLPEVPAKLLAPGGRIEDIRLLPLQGEPRAGTYGGRFVVREAGSYEIRLTLGDALNEQVLRQNLQVRLPTVELERPKRNDEDLTQFASMTGGEYIAVDEATSDDQVKDQLIDRLRPQPQTTILPGTPDIDFGARRNAALMWLIATMLTMEWVTRRLHRLA